MLVQFRKLFVTLSLRQRIFIGLAVAAAIGGLWWLNQWNHERSFQPLFAGLSAEDAGAVVAKLKETGVQYRISANGSMVSAPAERVAELRLQLAAAGIPKSGRIGYELFDKNNFGITDFAEQVNYRRAIEGELERSILVLSGVETARVHITPAKDSVFTEAKEPAKASVLVGLKPNAKLNPANVDAVAHLVASAVQGLDPEHVAVVDGSGRLLPGKPKPQGPDETGSADRALAFRQHIEKDLIDKINATLEPVLGAKRFRAGVSVDCDITSGEQSEETYDPSKAVVSNTQKSEETGAALANGGQPGTASALPRPAVRSPGQSTPMTRKTENTTYQNSHTIRRTKIPQGAVRRISVAVLMDHNLRWDVENGKPRRVLTAPAAEQLKTIRDMVSGVTGIDAKRGDTLVVESMAFDSTLAAEPPPGLVVAPKLEQKNMQELVFGIPRANFIAMAAAGGVVLLLLGGLAFRIVRNRRSRADGGRVSVDGALAPGTPGKKQLGGAGKGKGGAAHVDPDEEPEVADARRKLLEAKLAKEVLSAIQMPESTSKKAQVLAKHITEEAKKSPEAMAEYVRSWLSGEDK